MILQELISVLNLKHLTSSDDHAFSDKVGFHVCFLLKYCLIGVCFFFDPSVFVECCDHFLFYSESIMSPKSYSQKLLHRIDLVFRINCRRISNHAMQVAIYYQLSVIVNCWNYSVPHFHCSHYCLNDYRPVYFNFILLQMKK